MPKKKLPQKNDLPEKKTDYAIPVAIIGLIGVMITAIFSSPALVVLLQRTPAPTVTPSIIPTSTLALTTNPAQTANPQVLPTFVMPTIPTVVFENTSSSGERIAFVLGDNEQSEIYSINTNGSNLQRLTNNNAGDVFPSWSPDGKHIVFESWRDGAPEIYIMNPDGTFQTRLTTNSVSDKSPSWSPDGKSVAFRSNRDGNFQLYLMNSDGSNQTRLTNTQEDIGDFSFSPDGQKIVYEEDSYDVNFLNLVDLKSTRLGDEKYIAWSPTWSTDGQFVVFVARYQYQLYFDDPRLYIVNLIGGEPIRLADTLASHPTWSPNGQILAFLEAYKEQLYVMNSDGSKPTPLTDKLSNNGGEVGSFTWSPDGKQIAYIDGDSIYVINSDGSNKNAILIMGGQKHHLSWSK